MEARSLAEGEQHALEITEIHRLARLAPTAPVLLIELALDDDVVQVEVLDPARLQQEPFSERTSFLGFDDGFPKGSRHLAGTLEKHPEISTNTIASNRSLGAEVMLEGCESSKSEKGGGGGGCP